MSRNESPREPAAQAPRPAAEVGLGAEDDASAAARYERLPLLGALLKFKVKLIANGMLDLMLVPASLVAVVLGMFMGGSDPGRYFRELMLFGRRTERWINLFGGYSNVGRRGGIDALLGTYENEVAAMFERRGWSAPTEAALRSTALRGRAPVDDPDARTSGARVPDVDTSGSNPPPGPG